MTLIRVKRKYRVVKHAKGEVAKDGGGHSGNGPMPARYRKKHLLASGPPGTPRGICVQGNPAYKHVRCQCGKQHGR